ncbi:MULTISPECIES: flavin reductase [unclassified Mesorhizobium]|uniref:flavin reductase n=1 Tax=unclassified Mesorhizobium TaxID=325217 RepID=UPI00112B3EA5|nr:MULTISPECIES: flavin reductase [unclassified Mesorhizobium]MBZ9810302.1 flavin reductase [Mesorhizobium sp. ESP-6-2]MBZ9943051.1 flavin reductase [Mesorhizobium sp. BR1-1-13]TPM24949.1 flavin reductase [Mesorhizobium sp. B2-2-2]
MTDKREKELSTIDPVELRRTFGTFVTGITVVTTRDEDGSPRGMTANSFTSVSLEPPLLLVCIGKSASSFPAFNTAEGFAVNVLHDRQKEVASLFASKSLSKFETIAHTTVHTGSPVLTDSLTWFDCTVHDRIEAGDHVILIGRVRAFGTSPAAPLGFCRGRYVCVEDPMPPGWTPSHRMIIGYLVEHDGRILLRDDGAGGWELPTATHRKPGDMLSFEGGGVVAPLTSDAFLYSVFDVADQQPGYVVYRGALAGPPGEMPDLSPSLRFFAHEELPWDSIPIRQIRATLRRYLHERADSRFGIYVDSSDGGRVAMIDGPPRPWRSLNGLAGDRETAKG